MPLNSRDLWIVLKAQDMATRALNSFSRATAGAARSVQLANLQAMKSSAQRALTSRRLAESLDRITISELNMQRAILRSVAAERMRTGITEQENAAFIAQDQALRNEILTRQHALNMNRAETVALQQRIAGYDRSIATVRKSIDVEQEHQRAMTVTSNKLRAVAQNSYAVSFAITALGVATAVALKGAVDSAVEYNRTVALTKTQVDGFKVSLDELGKMGMDVANQIGVSFDQIQPALYDIFSSTDANLAQSKILLIAFSKAAVAGQVSLEDAGRSTMQLMNAFRIPAEKVNDVLDLQFQLVRKGVGTYGQFASVIGRAVPSAVRAGQSLKTLDAMLVFLTRNGLSAAMSAASAGRALDALSNPKTVDRLNAIGVKVKDIHGKFLPLVNILQQLHDKLMKMPPADRVKALQDLLKGSGGTIQARRFLDLVLLQPGQMENFVKFLGDMGDATGQFSQAYNQMANSTAAKAQVLKNNWQSFKVTLGDSLIPVFTKLLSIFAKVLQWYNKLSPGTKDLVAKFLAISAAVMLIVGPILGVIGLLASLSAALAAVGLTIGEVLLIVGLVAAVIVGLGVALYLAYTRSKPLRDLFANIGGIFKDVWNILKGFVDGVKQKFEKDMLPAFMKLWTTINTKVVPVINDLVTKFRDNLRPILSSLLADIKNIIDVGFKVLSWAINHLVIPAIQLATKYYNEHKDSIDKVIHYIMIAVKWIGIIAGGAVLGALVLVIVAVIGFFYAWIQAYIHVLEWTEKATKAFISFKDKVRNAFLTLLQAVVAFFDLMVQGAAKAFGWIPGIGPKLKQAAKEVDAWAKHVNSSIQDIKDHDVNIRLKLIGDKIAKEDVAKGYKIVRAFASGGIVPGPKGKPQLAVVHGGEEVLTEDQQKEKNSGGNTYYQTVNVYTNEIRPVATAAQLGRLFAARVS